MTERECEQARGVGGRCRRLGVAWQPNPAHLLVLLHRRRLGARQLGEALLARHRGARLGGGPLLLPLLLMALLALLPPLLPLLTLLVLLLLRDPCTLLGLLTPAVGRLAARAVFVAPVAAEAERVILVVVVAAAAAAAAARTAAAVAHADADEAAAR